MFTLQIFISNSRNSFLLIYTTIRGKPAMAVV